MAASEAGAKKPQIIVKIKKTPCITRVCVWVLCHGFLMAKINSDITYKLVLYIKLPGEVIFQALFLQYH